MIVCHCFLSGSYLYKPEVMMTLTYKCSKLPMHNQIFGAWDQFWPDTLKFWCLRWHVGDIGIQTGNAVLSKSHPSRSSLNFPYLYDNNFLCNNLLWGTIIGFSYIFYCNWFNTDKKALRETQTLRDGCSKVEPKKFLPPKNFARHRPPTRGHGTAKI